ncbi:hypothetical protein HYDPIDRAFT_104139, partial [Hydnomerulius pinastri MD-312]
NDNELFPKRDAQTFYDFGQANEAEWLVNKILAHRWCGHKVEFLVKWNMGDSIWEPHDHCKDFEALDNYLELQGAPEVRLLPRAASQRDCIRPQHGGNE